MALFKRYKDDRVFRYGVNFCVLGLIIFNVRFVQLLGPMIIGLAPNLFILGVALIITSHTKQFVPKLARHGLIYPLAILVCGLNTRIPEILYDAIFITWRTENFTEKLNC